MVGVRMRVRDQAWGQDQGLSKRPYILSKGPYIFRQDCKFSGQDRIISGRTVYFTGTVYFTFQDSDFVEDSDFGNYNFHEIIVLRNVLFRIYVPFKPRPYFLGFQYEGQDMGPYILLLTPFLKFTLWYELMIQTILYEVVHDIKCFIV